MLQTAVGRNELLLLSRIEAETYKCNVFGSIRWLQNFNPLAFDMDFKYYAKREGLQDKLL